MMEHLAKVGETWPGFQESPNQAVLSSSYVVGALLHPGFHFLFFFYLFPPKSCPDLLKSPSERILKCVHCSPGSGVILQSCLFIGNRLIFLLSITKLLNYCDQLPGDPGCLVLKGKPGPLPCCFQQHLGMSARKVLLPGLEVSVVAINSYYLMVGPVKDPRSSCILASHEEPRNPKLVGLPKP